MCLIAMAWGVSAQYPLVIASNRDEFYARPTAPLAEWTTPEGHTIYSGRDLRDGGTWLGFAQSGRFAMLTNVRNPAAPMPAAARSRGALVMADQQPRRRSLVPHAEPLGLCRFQPHHRRLDAPSVPLCEQPTLG
jgi:uncharacterized protein with NRDE domain